MDLLFDVLTLIQTRKITQAPVILIDSEYLQPCFDWLRDTVLASGCISKPDLDLFKIADNAQEAKKIIMEHRIKISSSPVDSEPLRAASLLEGWQLLEKLIVQPTEL